MVFLNYMKLFDCVKQNTIQRDGILINDCLNWDFLDFSFYIEEVTILDDIYNGFCKTVKVRYPI
jgi:hypothetical protein